MGCTSFIWRAVELRILKNFKSLQNDNETGRTGTIASVDFIQTRQKLRELSIVRSVLNSDDQPSAFKCARKRCNTCLFIHNADKITGPKRLIKITNRFTCTSANVIHCKTCTLCKNIYIGEIGRGLGDRIREHLRRR